MKKAFTLLSLILLSGIATAQIDAALAAPNGSITSPVSSCVLTANESITVSIFNFGPGSITTNFDVSYSINGGPPVTETIAGPTIPQNTSYLYTFLTTADFSVPGSYSINATVTLPGDPTPGNDTYVNYIVNSIAPSVGGTVTGPSSVCISGNSGTLNLAGQTGTILRWEYSTDGGGTWVNISNNTTFQNYNNLTVPTMYRAVVQNSSCAPANSSSLSIGIDQVSVGGTTAPATTTVCSGANSGNVTLSGKTGNVVNWESSIDGGITWTPIANTTTTQPYLNITTSTRYRAVIQNGSCPTVNSSVSAINATPASVGGNITPLTTTVCSGSNSGTLTLSGHTGSIVRWEFSTNGGGSWTNIANTTTTQNYTNLNGTRLYRTRIQNGICAATYSDTATVTVVPSTIAGTLSANANVCSGTNTGTLTLAGSVGTITRWEFSIDGGVTWTNIANTTLSESYNNLTVTTQYRVLVQNGSCASNYSNSVTITVSPATVAGSISGTTTVCSGSNSGTLTLSGHTGSVLNWEFSTDGGLTWSNIVNTTTTQNYTNLNATQMYRAQVQSGVCTAAFSGSATVTVVPSTVSGTLSSAATVCSGANNGTLTLAGNSGSIVRWEFSINAGVSWTNIANTTNSQVYSNLTTTTRYRVQVQNGTCPAAYSNSVIITVDPVSVGGTIAGSTTVCSGTNSGTLTLSGNTGTILSWEFSTDAGITWTSIANNTNTETFNNLTTTTDYLVIVQSGVCQIDSSAITTITVDPVTVGGTVAGSTTACYGANSGSVNLSGETGSVLNWEYSTDGGSSWINISNTTTTQNYINLTTPTLYRALVQSGLCAPAYSGTAAISIDPPSAGGNIFGSTTVCSGFNTGTLSLIGFSGNILDWQSSINGGTNWTSVGNTSSTYNFFNLTTTTMYRAVVQSGVCPLVFSTFATVTVDDISVGGTVITSDTVCSGANSGTLNLIGETGNVIGWEFSTDTGVTWINLANNTTSQNYINLTTTTMYRALVKNGVCTPVNSAPAIITVELASDAGTLTGGATVCPGSTGTLNLNGYVGAIQNWESSVDAGATWFLIPVSTNSLNYYYITDTTWYRVAVVNGACDADTSNIVAINVYAQPQANFTANNVCIGNAVNFINTSFISSGSIKFNIWDMGDGSSSMAENPIYNYSDTGNYSISLVTISDFNCSDTATLNITVFDLPTAEINTGGKVEFCLGDSLTLSAPQGANLVYLWSNGDISSSIVVDSSGTYMVTVTDTVSNCSANDSVKINVLPLPIADAGRDTTINPGQSITLNGSGGITYLWAEAAGLNNPHVFNPVATLFNSTTYILMVTDEYNCSSTDTISITMEGKPAFKVANMITPNGDGFNDYWFIDNIELFPANQVTVFNRNGQQVFISDAYDNAWGGTFNGKPLPDGTYYYILKFTESGEVQKGAVTILRTSNN